MQCLDCNSEGNCSENGVCEVLEEIKLPQPARLLVLEIFFCPPPTCTVSGCVEELGKSLTWILNAENRQSDKEHKGYFSKQTRQNGLRLECVFFLAPVSRQTTTSNPVDTRQKQLQY